MAVLVVLGAADGCTSVAMNAQAVQLQYQYRRPVLNSLHALRSIGAVAGGMAGVATAALDLPLRTQFVLMAVGLAAISAVAVRGLPSAAEQTQPASGRRTGRSPEASKPGPAGRERNGRLIMLLLALMTFLAALVSDAPASWSGIYLRHVGADAAVAAAGYAAFSAGEVTTRLLNDRLVNRLGWVCLIRAGTLCCAVAFSAALLLGLPWPALVAFVIAGAGISAVFPGAFSAAGALPHPALAMGQIGFAGNLGWLLVSPVVGGLATLVGLSAALGVLAVAAVTIAGLASATGIAAPAESGAPRTVRRVNG